MKNHQRPEYQVWCNMVARCTNPTRDDYSRYGGRGITVCQQWRSGTSDLTGFEAFVRDIGPRPTPKHTLDRIDNDGNYEPGNCRWATALEQANNKRTSHFIVYRGRRMTIADAAREAGAGVTRETARCRIRTGWSIEAAVETPLGPRRGGRRPEASITSE